MGQRVVREEEVTSRRKIEELADRITRELDALTHAEHAEVMRLVKRAWNIDTEPESFCRWGAALALYRGISLPGAPTSLVTECAALDGVPEAEA